MSKILYLGRSVYQFYIAHATQSTLNQVLDFGAEETVASITTMGRVGRTHNLSALRSFDWHTNACRLRFKMTLSTPATLKSTLSPFLI